MSPKPRLQLVRDRTREWQRLEKLLEGALIKLSFVVWSLARTKTARDILEAIAGGERDPTAPEELRERAVKMLSEVREREGRGHGELARVA